VQESKQTRYGQMKNRRVSKGGDRLGGSKKKKAKQKKNEYPTAKVPRKIPLYLTKKNGKYGSSN